VAQKTYPTPTRVGVVMVPSRTRLGVEHAVTLPTCSCEHFTLSRRDPKDGYQARDDDWHINKTMADYLEERGYTVIPPQA
jgi:hypothetical protein